MAIDSYSAMQSGAYGIQAVGSLAGAFAESEALKAQSSFQRTMALINKRFADERATDVIRAGESQANAINVKGKQVAGAQRAAAAAQGLDVSDGSVAEQIDDTTTAVQNEMIKTRANAWRSAWGIKTEANFNVLESGQKSSAARFAAEQTLLTGGLKSIGSGVQSASYWGK